MLRVFNHDAPVTQYSSAVFDTFADQVKVSTSLGLLHFENNSKNDFSSGENVFIPKTKT